MSQLFVPTWKWHIKVLLVILLLCGLAFWGIACIVSYLPQPYQKRVPAQEVTPWLK